MIVTRPLQVELHDIADTVRDANVRMVTDMVMRAEEGIQGAQPIFHSATTMNARKADALRQHIRQVLHEHAQNTGQTVTRNQLSFKINLRNIEDTAKQNQQGRMKQEYEDAHIGKAYIMWASIDCITALGASNAFFGRALKVEVPGSTAYTTRFEQDEKNMGAVLVNKRGDASGTIAEAEAELSKAKDMMEAAAAGRLFSVTHLAGVGADTSRERLVHRLSDLQVQAHIVDSEREWETILVAKTEGDAQKIVDANLNKAHGVHAPVRVTTVAAAHDFVQKRTALQKAIDRTKTAPQTTNNAQDAIMRMIATRKVAFAAKQDMKMTADDERMKQHMKEQLVTALAEQKAVQLMQQAEAEVAAQHRAQDMAEADAVRQEAEKRAEEARKRTHGSDAVSPAAKRTKGDENTTQEQEQEDEEMDTSEGGSDRDKQAPETPHAPKKLFAAAVTGGRQSTDGGVQ
eukprot:g6513.t1